MSLSSFYRAIVFCAFLATGVLNAQHLTISTSGDNGPTSGTNWSINTSTNELIVTGTGTTAHIHPNVITNHLGNAGQLFIILPWQGGTERNININSSISYGSSRAATLVFYSANHINIASGISIGSTNFPLHLALNTRYNVNYSVNSGMPDYGKTAFTNNTITTKGGHFWVGGGGTSSTLKQFSGTFWIGDDAAVTWVHGETGLQVSGTTITTDGGNVSMSGWGYPSSTGGNTSYGLTMSNSTINSGAGNITLTGQINGTYTNGIGLALWPDASGAVSLTTTSGNISLTGKGYDIGTVTAGGGWRNGLILEGGANSVTLSTQSGNITLDGQASFNYQVNDKEGLHIYSPTTDRIKIISRTGNITLKGSNTREGDGQYCNGIVFRASDVSNAIRIGHDGTNSYSGNILIQSNSILQNTNNAGSGSISVKSTGTLTVEPKDNAFTYLRAGASGTLTFDNDWDFGTTLSGFTFGKNHSTALDLSYTNTLTVAGPITFHTGNFTINNNMTSSTASSITINANANFNTSGTRQTITTTGGNIIIHADKDANGSGVLDLDYLTLNPGSGNIIIRGSTFFWTTTNTTDKPYLNGTGSITIEPSSASFGQEPNTAWFVFDQDGDGMSGLTIGKSGNTTNITYSGTALTVAGPVTLYGGTLTLSSDLTCTASGDVSLYTDAALSISGARTITTTGAFKYISQSASFAATVSFPITNLTLTNVTGVQIGKSGNTAGVTIGTNTSINGYFTAYGGTIALNANITTTNTGTGDITLSGSTLSGSGNLAVAGGRTASITVTSASTYDGIISGTGSGLTKLGAGALTLTKDHTYTGATTISAGDLQVGSGGSVSQASSGSLATASAVSVASGCKLILAPNENMTFANNVSGSGGLEIKGMSGAYYNSFLTGTATTMVSNASVLEVLTRITGGLQDGAAVAAGATRTAGAYVKSYNAATNTATLQFQQFDGVYTKCVFAQLSQSGTNVQIAANTSVYSGAAYRTGNSLGSDMSTGSTAIGALATSSGASGYGISNVYMSGKVNFTGSLTYSGTTTLSNTVTSVTSPNTYSYTSRGTQEITNASTSFPSGSSIVNNGLVIFNRTTALTVSNDMSGTEEVLQVGADITMTGANTYTGNTTIDLNKTLNIGSGGTSGSMTGNIINYGTLSFNRSDSSSYSGVISGTGAVIKSGNSATTLTGLNTYTGATTINAGRLILQRDVPATSSSGYSGAGILVVQPNSNSFTNAVTYPIAGFTVSSSIGGLTIGKPTNTASITVNSATQAAGPITLYGGSITVSSTLTAAGNILLDADVGSFLTQNSKGVTISAAVTTTTASNGNINILARGGSGSGYFENHGIQCTQTIEAGGTGNISITAYGGLSSSGISSSCHGINLDGSSAWIKSNGGNVAISGFGGGAGSGTYSQGFAMLNSSKVSAAGSGTISINGTGGVNSVIGLRGIVLVSSSSIYTAGGTITLTGNNGTNGSDNSDGITIDNATVGSNSSGAITLTGYAGGGTGSEAISLSSSSTIGGTTHAGNILMQGNAFSIASAASILTTGQLTIEPTSGSFSAALTYPISNLTVASTITGLTLGKSGNTANITLGAAQSVAGPIAVYGGTLTFNDNVSSTTGGNINLYGNTLSFTSGKTVSSTGQLLVAPTAVSTTVGLAGATGTLQVTSTHLSTNFANGFSNITIGSDAQTGNIASNAFTLQDNMTFKTTGTLSLGGNITLGTNNATLSNALSMGTGTNYFLTNSTGVLKRSVGNAGTFAFPVGNSAYNPVSITNNTGAADEFNLRVLDEVYRDGTSGSVLTSPRVKRTWLIGKTNANAGSGINFVFNWNTGESTSGLNSPRLYHYNGTEWEKQTGTTSSTSTSLTYTGYTGTFSPFAIGDDVVLLPVNWLSFDCGKKTSQGTELNWSTASEQNSNRFIIERSQNGKTFEPIASIPAAGYSHSIRQYSFTDPNPLKTMGYYRIAMEENNGSKEYSGICMNNGNISAENTSVSIHPNPSNGSVNIRCEEGGSYQIFDMAGRLVRAGKLDNHTQIDGLKPGIYSLCVQTGDNRYTQKLLVE